MKTDIKPEPNFRLLNDDEVIQYGDKRYRYGYGWENIPAALIRKGQTVHNGRVWERITPVGKIKLLNARSTSYILSMLRSTYPANWEDDFSPINAILEGIPFSRTELKDYLATRPHILNKKESKEARKLRKKSGEGRK